MNFSLFILICIFLVGCKKKEIQGFTEISTENRKISSVSISLEPSEGMPYQLLIHINSLIEPFTQRISDGTPSGIAVRVSQEDLEHILATINDFKQLSKTESFQSIRSPDTKVEAPNLPHVGAKLSREEKFSLQIRSTSIFQDAYYICEFAMIKEKESARSFLKWLRNEIKNEQVVEAMDRLIARY